MVLFADAQMSQILRVFIYIQILRIQATFVAFDNEVLPKYRVLGKRVVKLRNFHDFFLFFAKEINHALMANITLPFTDLGKLPVTTYYM